MDDVESRVVTYAEFHSLEYTKIVQNYLRSLYDRGVQTVGARPAGSCIDRA